MVFGVRGIAPAARRGSPGYRWVVMGAVLAGQAALGTVQHGLPALGPALRSSLGLSLSQVGLVFSGVAFGTSATLLAWGWFADRVGERAAIGCGLIAGSGALVAAAFAPGFEITLVTLTAAAALTAGAATSGRAVVGWFGADEQGFAFGVRQTAVPLGAAVSAVALPALAAASGLRAALLAAAGMVAAGGTAALAWIREPATPQERAGSRGPGPLRDPRAWRLAAGGALLFSSQTTILTFVVVFLHDHREMAAGTAAAVLAAVHVCGALSRLAVGRRSDRSGGRIAYVRGLGGASGLALVIVALAADAPTAILAAVLIGTGTLAMSYNALVFTAASEYSGRDRAGTAIGLQQTVMLLSGAALIYGFASAVAALSWPAAFALVAALPIAGAAVLRPLEAAENRPRARRRPW
jgi:sugar phosphate permease